jgi:hypothetical protein
MWLLLTYIALALVGNGIVYLVGLLIEQAWPIASLPAFLFMFFAVMWFAWLAAVKLTAPKAEAQA